VHKVNTTKMAELTWSSSKGKFTGAGKQFGLVVARAGVCDLGEVGWEKNLAPFVIGY
jgi:hypothetical protein